MPIPFLSEAEINWAGQDVLVRIDSDVPLKKVGSGWAVREDYRLRLSLATIHYLQRQGVKRIILLGHLGRPAGHYQPSLSLQPVANWFRQQFGRCPLIGWGKPLLTVPLQLRENLRFQPGELSNDPHFSQRLAHQGNIFVNDAFAVSHRHQASVVGLPRLLPSFLGLRFEAEIKTLRWLRRQAKHPRLVILGGAKKDKLAFIPFFLRWADYLLLGGKLPLLLGKSQFVSERKLSIAHLNSRQSDISQATCQRWQVIIQQAATILWAGPLGKYENPKLLDGSPCLVTSIRQSSAFKIAAGGDTQAMLRSFKLWANFDFISSGGGASLTFLRDQTLAGLQALGIDKDK